MNIRIRLARFNPPQQKKKKKNPSCPVRASAPVAVTLFRLSFAAHKNFFSCLPRLSSLPSTQPILLFSTLSLLLFFSSFPNPLLHILFLLPFCLILLFPFLSHFFFLQCGRHLGVLASSFLLKKLSILLFAVSISPSDRKTRNSI